MTLLCIVQATSAVEGAGGDSIMQHQQQPPRQQVSQLLGSHVCARRGPPAGLAGGAPTESGTPVGVFVINTKAVHRLKGHVDDFTGVDKLHRHATGRNGRDNGLPVVILLLMTHSDTFVHKERM